MTVRAAVMTRRMGGRRAAVAAPPAAAATAAVPPATRAAPANPNPAARKRISRKKIPGKKTRKGSLLSEACFNLTLQTHKRSGQVSDMCCIITAYCAVHCLYSIHMPRVINKLG